MRRGTGNVVRSVAVTLGLVLASSGATSATAGAAPGLITLPAHSQPAPERPVLARLEKSAAQQGISFDAAVDAHVARIAGPVTRDAVGDEVLPHVMIDDLSVAELADLKSIAKAEGIGLAEAIDRHGWQSHLMRIREELRATFPDGFAGSTRTTDGSSAWFGFSGEVPREAVRLARTLPATVRLQGGLGFSEVELEAAKNAVHDEVMARPDVATATTSYDVETGAINVKVEPAATARSAANPAAISAGITSVALTGRMHVTVTIAADLGREPEDSIVRGGGHLGGCTAGFTLRGTTHPHHKRISTAGHCGEAGTWHTYQNHSSDGGSTRVEVMYSHEGELGDLAYATTGSFTALPTFYSAYHVKRSANARSGRPGVGDWVCHFGKSSGDSCSSVWSASEDQGAADNLVVMSQDISEPGDSGGPWYYGTTAIGIHYGDHIDDNDRRRSAFTIAAKFLERNFDVYLK